MASAIAIEEESGTGTGRIPEHNGYYAGDFWPERQAPRHNLAAFGSPGRRTSVRPDLTAQRSEVAA